MFTLKMYNYSELASENLLFLTEYHQLKSSLRLSKEKWQEYNLWSDLCLSKRIPKTKFSFKSNQSVTQAKFNKYINSLHNKYIVLNSLFEINIGFELRFKCDQALNNLIMLDYYYSPMGSGSPNTTTRTHTNTHTH